MGSGRPGSASSGATMRVFEPNRSMPIGPSTARFVTRRPSSPAGDGVEQLQRGGLGGGDEHLAAEILELREEARVHRDLVPAGVLEDDHGATGAVAVRVLLAADQRRAGGREHRHRQVMPVRERVVALRLRHLVEVMAVALGERGDRRPDGGVGQKVVGGGHTSSMAAGRQRSADRV